MKPNYKVENPDSVEKTIVGNIFEIWNLKKDIVAKRIFNSMTRQTEHYLVPPNDRSFYVPEEIFWMAVTLGKD